MTIISLQKIFYFETYPSSMLVWVRKPKADQRTRTNPPKSVRTTSIASSLPNKVTGGPIPQRVWEQPALPGNDCWLFAKVTTNWTNFWLSTSFQHGAEQVQVQSHSHVLRFSISTATPNIFQKFLCQIKIQLHSYKSWILWQVWRVCLSYVHHNLYRI